VRERARRGGIVPGVGIISNQHGEKRQWRRNQTAGNISGSRSQHAATAA